MDWNFITRIMERNNCRQLHNIYSPPPPVPPLRNFLRLHYCVSLSGKLIRCIVIQLTVMITMMVTMMMMIQSRACRWKIRLRDCTCCADMTHRRTPAGPSCASEPIQRGWPGTSTRCWCAVGSRPVVPYNAITPTTLYLTAPSSYINDNWSSMMERKQQTDSATDILNVFQWKEATILMSVTSSNLNPLSKFFHRQKEN